MNIDLSKWTLIKSGQLEDEFEGFDDEMIFELTDGTVYYQSTYKYNYCYPRRERQDEVFAVSGASWQI